MRLPPSFGLRLISLTLIGCLFTAVVVAAFFTDSESTVKTCEFELTETPGGITAALIYEADSRVEHVSQIDGPRAAVWITTKRTGLGRRGDVAAAAMIEEIVTVHLREENDHAHPGVQFDWPDLAFPEEMFQKFPTLQGAYERMPAERAGEFLAALGPAAADATGRPEFAGLVSQGGGFVRRFVPAGVAIWLGVILGLPAASILLALFRSKSDMVDAAAAHPHDADGEPFDSRP